jgi:RNA polymerase sigma factor (sigma-70 family)
MSVGQPERETQDRVIRLFRDELCYRYLGDWTDRDGNSNIEGGLLTAYLTGRGYTAEQISRAIYLWRLLETITRRKFLKHVDKLGARKQTPKREGYPEGDDLRGEASEEAAIAADLMEAVLTGLDETYLAIFQKRLENCSEEEIAAKLGCTRKRVRARLNRIRARLGILLIDEHDPQVRGWAAHAIGEIGDDAKSAIPVLAEVLLSTNGKKEDDLFPAAARAIGILCAGKSELPEAKKVVPTLIRRLMDSNPSNSKWAAFALGSIHGSAHLERPSAAATAVSTVAPTIFSPAISSPPNADQKPQLPASGDAQPSGGIPNYPPSTSGGNGTGLEPKPLVNVPSTSGRH